MRVGIYIADKEREHTLARNLSAGVEACGDEAETLWRADFEAPLPHIDVACVVGVKNNSNWFIDEHLAAGKHTLYFDKGYVRWPARRHEGGWVYWRVAIDGHQPTKYFRQRSRGKERWKGLKLGIERIARGKGILYAGSSQKFCDYYRLGDATEYAKSIVAEIRKYTDKRIIYRPKPSWRHAVPIEGTDFSRSPQKIGAVLSVTDVMITYGSNAVFESILSGIPTICLGPAISRSISSTSIADVNDPYVAHGHEIKQWCYDLSYCQWKMEEYASGEAWADIKETLSGLS